MNWVCKQNRRNKKELFICFVLFFLHLDSPRLNSTRSTAFIARTAVFVCLLFSAVDRIIFMTCFFSFFELKIVSTNFCSDTDFFDFASLLKSNFKCTSNILPASISVNYQAHSRWFYSFPSKFVASNDASWNRHRFNLTSNELRQFANRKRASFQRAEKRT